MGQTSAFAEHGRSPNCPQGEIPWCICGRGMHWVDCWDCGGEGYHDDLYEQDPLWYDEDDIEICSTCHGKSGYWICDSVPED